MGTYISQKPSPVDVQVPEHRGQDSGANPALLNQSPPTADSYGLVAPLSVPGVEPKLLLGLSGVSARPPYEFVSVHAPIVAPFGTTGKSTVGEYISSWKKYSTIGRPFADHPMRQYRGRAGRRPGANRQRGSNGYLR